MNISTTWLAASYHFPATYSCRAPMSSIASGLALPTPGPNTVRLALARTSIEVLGLEYTRNELFPILSAMPICVRPPEQVAISNQIMRIYKASDNSKETVRLDESIGYREVAQANGAMTIYLHVPRTFTDILQQVLNGIGYWGKADSLTQCVEVTERSPILGEYMLPLTKFTPSKSVGQFFACFAADFSRSDIRWEEVQFGSNSSNWLIIQAYVWPLELREKRGGGKLMRYRSLSD